VVVQIAWCLKLIDCRPSRLLPSFFANFATKIFFVFGFDENEKDFNRQERQELLRTPQRIPN
jgi:hypothetical protein